MGCGKDGGEGGKQKWSKAKGKTNVGSAQSRSRGLGSLVQSQRNDWKEETTLPLGGMGSGEPPQDWGMAWAKFLA